MLRWFVLFLTAFLPSISFADSSLSITKVVSGVPGTNAGHQYIEVSNIGSDPIDLGAKTIRIVDHSGKHLIKSVNGSGASLAPAGEVVIAQNPDMFRSDNPWYSGVVLKSSFNLTKSGIVSIAQTDGMVLASKAYAPVVAQKPVVTKSSSSKQERHYSRSSTKTAYGKGIGAPSAKANAEADGASYALPLSPEVLAFANALASNVWFALFLSLMAFSVFSISILPESHKFA